MKNEFTTGRLYHNYFLKAGITLLSVPVNKMKKHWGRFRKEMEMPLLSDAVSQGLIDFFEEMGYSGKNI
jgi:hypothetical protein